jgi:hypothetical protein
MEVKELRIGNYFIYNTDGCFPNNPEWESNTITVVRQIKEDGVGITHLKTTGIMVGGLELIKPIPLTEEWLIKFGFKKINGCGYRKPNFKGSIWTNPGTWRFNNFMVDVKHVHQLQNLYFALTKKELTIKK